MSDAPEMLNAQPIKRYQGIDVDNEDGTVAWGCGLRTKEDGGPSIQLVDASAYDAALRRITELEEQRRGFEQAALDNETAAKKAKEQLAACRREFFEYRKVAWENEEIGHKALDDLQKAREAGRREGLESLKSSLDYRLNEYLCEMKPDYDDSIVGFNEARDVIRQVFAKALIDSPEGE